MSTALTTAAAFAGANLLLLSILTAIWLRSYLEIRTSLVLGLAAFGAVLLLENLIALYFFFSMQMLYAADQTVHTVAMGLRILQFIALCFLSWSTLQ